MRILSFIFISILLLPAVTGAQVTSDFFIRLSGPADTEAPSTPTLLSVTPIAASQIDVAWTAATDNAVVAGYSVLRDGVPVATTSLLVYSDTSLAASTTYSYTVRAFDPSSNYSLTSNSLATTTLALPPPTPPTPRESGTQGTAARVVMDDFVLQAGVSTTTISIVTAHQARLEFRWGRTASYELGYVLSNVFTKEHAITLTDLEPQTTYEYELMGYTPLGASTVLERGTFTTVGLLAPALPINVSRFSAVEQGTSVALSWENPAITSLAQVRVVRSHFGFPEHPHDGAIVYQGKGTKAFDEAILEQYARVYYTAFVYDSNGNVSSGAVAMVVATAPPSNSPDIIIPPFTTGGEVIPVTVPTTTVVTERVTAAMKMPNLGEIRVLQATSTFNFADDAMVLNAAQPFVIAIPRNAVAGNLKSIIATIHDPQATSSHSYLLRINRDRTAYEAEIAALETVGEGTMVVAIYDYEAFVVATYQTPVTFVVTSPVSTAVLFPDVLFAKWRYLLFGVAIIGAVVLLLLLLKRRKTGEDKA